MERVEARSDGYAKSEHHIVTVRTIEAAGYDLPMLDAIECHCSAPEDASCRTHPDCDCEWISIDEDNPGHDTSGHPFEAGRPCWVKEWFDAAACGEATLYVGADSEDWTECGVPLVSRDGHIDVRLDGDVLEWSWAGQPTSLTADIAHAQRPLDLFDETVGETP